MITKKIIDKDFRILNKSCNSLTSPMDCGFGHNTEKIFNGNFIFCAVSDDDVEILYLEKGSKTLHKSAHESMDNLETTPLAALKGTPNQI